MPKGKFLIRNQGSGQFSRTDKLPPGEVEFDDATEEAYSSGKGLESGQPPDPEQDGFEGSTFETARGSFMRLQADDLQPCKYPLIPILSVMRGFGIHLCLNEAQQAAFKAAEAGWVKLSALVSRYSYQQACDDYKALKNAAAEEPTEYNFARLTDARSQEALIEAYGNSRRQAKQARKTLWANVVIPLLSTVYQGLLAELKAAVNKVMEEDAESRARWGFGADLKPSPELMAIRQAVLRFEICKTTPLALANGATLPLSQLSCLGCDL